MSIEKALEAAARARAREHAIVEHHLLEREVVNRFVNDYWTAFRCDAGIAAFLRAIAESPTPEMVEAGRAADNDAELAAQFSVSHNIWRAMASALAEQLEARADG